MMETHQCADVLFWALLSTCCIRIHIGVCLFIYLEACKGTVRRRFGRHSADGWEGVECPGSQMDATIIESICE